MVSLSLYLRDKKHQAAQYASGGKPGRAPSKRPDQGKPGRAPSKVSQALTQHPQKRPDQGKPGRAPSK
eukprot:1179917-Prorocentrum_minimum.AAC.1